MGRSHVEPSEDFSGHERGRLPTPSVAS